MSKPGYAVVRCSKVGAVVILLAGGLAAWVINHPGSLLYSQTETKSVRSGKTSPGSIGDSLRSAVAAYSFGRYKEAEIAAARVIDLTKDSKDPQKREHVARAKYILVFSAARRNDFALARKRFDDLQKEASSLSDKGKLDAESDWSTNTLEEEGAYQRAVCASAMGDKKTAEAELIQFMRDYPESPLIYGAIQRIERMHNGSLPKEAKVAWMEASGTAVVRQRERDRARLIELAMCTPECLAELLCRYGKAADTQSLAKEMKTSERGTPFLLSSKWPKGTVSTQRDYSLRKRDFANSLCL